MVNADHKTCLGVGHRVVALRGQMTRSGFMPESMPPPRASEDARCDTRSSDPW